MLLTDGQVKLTDFGLSKQVKDIDESGNMDLTSQVKGVRAAFQVTLAAFVFVCLWKEGNGTEGK